MALIIGSDNADTGMSQAIYSEMDKLLSPPLQKAVDEAKEAVDKAEGEAKLKAEGEAKLEEAKKALAATQNALEQARIGWKKLAYAIAKGVVTHIVKNMEVHEIKTQGDVSISVEGKTAPVSPNNHVHSISLRSVASDVVFTQNKDNTGRVE